MGSPLDEEKTSSLQNRKLTLLFQFMEKEGSFTLFKMQHRLKNLLRLNIDPHNDQNDFG